VQILGDDALMIVFEGFDAEVEHLFRTDVILPHLLQKTVLFAQNILVGDSMGGVESSDIHPSLGREQHQHYGE
jgi:hypothetical protein